jgi:hypothetical protein
MSKYEYFSYSNLLNANVWKNNKVHSRLGYTIELNFDWLLWLVEPTNYRYIYNYFIKYEYIKINMVKK